MYKKEISTEYIRAGNQESCEVGFTNDLDAMAEFWNGIAENLHLVDVDEKVRYGRHLPR
jgi:hypothetical protein